MCLVSDLEQLQECSLAKNVPSPGQFGQISTAKQKRAGPLELGELGELGGPTLWAQTAQGQTP